MKRIFTRALLVCLLVALLSGAARAEPVTVKLANKTDAKIFVALAQVSEGGEDSGDRVRGWFAVNPGKTRTVKFGNYSPVMSYFYYATSKGGKRIWAGKGDDGSTFQIHPTNAFNSHPDKKISGGKKVRFKHLSVSSEGKARVTFTAK